MWIIIVQSTVHTETDFGLKDCKTKKIPQSGQSIESARWTRSEAFVRVMFFLLVSALFFYGCRLSLDPSWSQLGGRRRFEFLPLLGSDVGVWAFSSAIVCSRGLILKVGDFFVLIWGSEEGEEIGVISFPISPIFPVRVAL